MQFIVSHGLVGLLGFTILFLSTLALLVVAIILACVMKSRRPLIRFSVFCLFPLVVGVLTAVVLRACQSPADLTQSPELGHWVYQIRYFAYLGIGATLTLWVINFLVILTKPRTAQPPASH